MIVRQRTLLRLMELEGGKVSKLRLVKLAFLLRQSGAIDSSSSVYEFLPYHFGPYSFTLSHELKTLERDGWICVTETEIVAARPTGVETKKITNLLEREINSLVAKFRETSTEDLVSEVYRSFPRYTVLARNVQRRAAIMPTANPAVYTVGYEGLMLDGLLNLLLQSGIKQLADVRCNPVARRFGFHKSTLDRHCKDVGISYVHLPDLGIPSSWRQELNGTAAYEKLFDRYETEILPANDGWVKEACRLVQDRPSALMCMEADAVCCHRSRLARVVAQRTGLPLQELRCR